MRTTKRTIIHLDKGDELDIWFEGLAMTVTASAAIEGDREDAKDRTLQLVTDDVVWANVEGNDAGTQLVSEEGNCRITLI